MKIVPQLRNCLLSFGCIACDELINILVSNQFDQTNWKENETINLDNTACNNIEVHNTSSQTYDEQVSTIWDNMVGSHKKNSRVNILADGGVRHAA